MKIRGFTRFSIDGLNIEKLINNLSGDNIKLCDIDRKSHKKIMFSVPYKHSKKVIAYLDKLCYNYKISGEKGLFPFAVFLSKRIALIIGAFLFAAVCLMPKLFVSEIKVYGCENIDGAKVLEVLRDSGIREMSFKRIGEKDVEKAIYSGFKGVSFVSAKYSGFLLEIKIVEETKAPAAAKTEVRDLVSDCGGVLTKLIVYQGTALVKAGDTVVKGQALIAGYRLKPDGTQIPVRAIGAAYGSAEIKYTEVFESSKAVLKRNGESFYIRYIDTLGIKFPVKKGEVPFAAYETETQYSYIFKNNFLPSRLVTVTFYNTETVIVKENFEKVKKIIIEEAEKKALKQSAQEGKTVSFETTVRDGGEIKYIDTLVKIEKSFIKNGE